MLVFSLPVSLRPWVLNLLEASIDQRDVLRAASLLKKKEEKSAETEIEEAR